MALAPLPRGAAAGLMAGLEGVMQTPVEAAVQVDFGEL